VSRIRRGKPGESAAFDAGGASTFAPRLDDEVVGWIAAEGGEDDLVDVHAEEMEGFGRLLAFLRSLFADEPLEGFLVGDSSARPESFASPPAISGSAVALCNANLGSRWRSFALRESGIMPSQRSPSRNDASWPLIRGEPSARRVASALWMCASKLR